MKFRWVLFLFPSLLFSAQVITEHPYVSCEEFLLKREMKIYKDPSLFMPNLNMLYTDPKAGWAELLKENPLLTTVKGGQRLMRLGPAREFKNFGPVARIYEMNDPRFLPKYQQGKKSQREIKNPMIVPVKICGAGDAYSDSLGFVLEADLKLAQVAEETENSVMPPSTVGNPIPKLKP